MFSFFKKQQPALFDSIKDEDNLTVIDSHKMTLAERKVWRQTMLKNSIKEVLDSLEISGQMYRYRLMPLDERWHTFIVMIETTQSFVLSKYVETPKLIDIEKLLKKFSFNNYGITIDAVYWRAADTIDVFDKAATRSLSSGKNKKTIDDLRKEYKHKIQDDALRYDDLNQSEIAAFREALSKGVKPSVSGKQYDTDLSPLGPE